MPTTRAPRRASHDDTYAVPQPSSIASQLASSAGSIPTSASGASQMPHVGSFSAHARSPAAT